MTHSVETSVFQVAIVWVLDTAHQIVVVQAIYAYLIIHWGDASFLDVNLESLKVCSSPFFISVLIASILYFN